MLAISLGPTWPTASEVVFTHTVLGGQVGMLVYVIYLFFKFLSPPFDETTFNFDGECLLNAYKHMCTHFQNVMYTFHSYTEK